VNLVSRRKLITSLVPAICLSKNTLKAERQITIGLLLAKSGQYFKSSMMAEKGINRALTELNIKNASFKKKISIVKEEYNGDPISIHQKINNLLNKNVDIIFSPFGDSSSLSTSNILLKKNTPLININLSSSCINSTIQLGPTINQLTYPLIKTLINTGRRRYLFIGDTGITSSSIRNLSKNIISNSNSNSLAFEYLNIGYFENNSEEIYKIAREERFDVIILARSFGAGNMWLKDAVDRGITKYSDIALIDIDDSLTNEIQTYGPNAIYQITTYNKHIDPNRKNTLSKFRPLGSLSFIYYLAILVIHNSYGNMNQMLGKSFYLMDQKLTVNKKGMGVKMPLYLLRTDDKGTHYSGSYGLITPNLYCKETNSEV